MATVLHPMTPPSFSLRIRGSLLFYDRPAVMAIVNATPDSFFEGSRRTTAREIAAQTSQALAEGADMIDVGAYSARPGADDVAPEEEIARLTMALKAIRGVDSSVVVSVDTFRPEVARVAVEELGADIINDIKGSDPEQGMVETVARLGVPYIAMHMRGVPSTMQSLTDYGPDGVVAAVGRSLASAIERLETAGVCDIIADPGFGFAKTVEQNWDLLNHLPELGALLRRPILVGVSRKTMLYKPLGITASEALHPTIAANTLAIAGGAAIIRVHDVAPARRIVDLTSIINAKN